MPTRFLDLNLPPTLPRFFKRNSINLVITLATCESSHPQVKCSSYGKVFSVCNKKNHFKVCCQYVGKKVYEIEKDESDEPTSHSDYKIFIETINIENSAYINQINIENSDWSVTLPSNEIPVSYKIDTRAQCNAIPLTNLKKFDPEHNLCPVNIKLYANNNAITHVLGKCSLTLKHKKDSLNVSYPYRG